MDKERPDQTLIPPHSTAAEQAVFGTLLLGVHRGEDERVGETMGRLTPDSFYAPRHRLIFGAFEELYRAGRSPNLIAVTDELRQRGHLDEAGGACYVTALLQSAFSVSMLPSLVAILERDRTKRTLRDLGGELWHGANNGHDIEALTSLIDRVRDSISFASPRERGRGGIECAADLLAEKGETAQAWWPLWAQHGIVGPGLVTLLSGHAKVGKSETAWSGIRNVHIGLPALSVLVLTEEPRSLIVARLRRLGLEPAGLSLRFADGTSWPALLREVERTEARLLLVDTLRSFAGISDENDAARVVAAVQPLVLLMRRKAMAALVLHHLRKTEGEEGLGAAGSTALVALADVALELRRDRHAAETRRVLKGVSRFEETPRDLVLERRDGEIVPLGSATAVALREVADRVLAVLPDEDADAMSLQEALPTLGEPRPSPEQVRRALDHLHSSGRAVRNGKGVKGDPHRWSRR